MEMGRNEMVVWYQSPYPEEYTTLPKIYICEFCLKYMKFSSVMKRHASKCVWKHPPGITEDERTFGIGSLISQIIF